LLCDLASSDRGTDPGLMQEAVRQTHLSQWATKAQFLAQMHPILLDIVRLFAGQMEYPWQPLPGQPLAHAGHRSHARLDKKDALRLSAKAVAPLQPDMLLIYPQPQPQQWPEQRLQTHQPLQRFQQVGGMPQGMTGGAIMPGQPLLADQEAADIGRELLLQIADQAPKMPRACHA